MSSTMVQYYFLASPKWRVMFDIFYIEFPKRSKWSFTSNLFSSFKELCIWKYTMDAKISNTYIGTLGYSYPHAQDLLRNLGLFFSDFSLEWCRCSAIAVKGSDLNFNLGNRLVERLMVFESVFMDTQTTCVGGSAVIMEASQTLTVIDSTFTNNTGREGVVLINWFVFKYWFFRIRYFERIFIRVWKHLTLSEGYELSSLRMMIAKGQNLSPSPGVDSSSI